jgi:uncharacterized delta-60 repeat protein
MKARFFLPLVCLFCLILASVSATAKPSNGGACPAIVPINPPIDSPTSAPCANSGCPDTSFNGAGFVITNTDGSIPKQNDVDSAQAVQQVIMPDGSTRLLAIGTTSNSTGSQGIALVRYNSDGSPDHGFGSNGIVTEFLPSVSGLVVDGVVDASGNIVVLSSANSGGSFVVARFLPSGALDTSFNSKGYSSIISVKPESLALDTNGNILIGGIYYPGKNVYGAVVRLTPGGTLDSSFGAAGQVTITALGDVSGLTTEGVNSANYILAGGGNQVLRLSANGAIDHTFGGGAGVAVSNLCGFGYNIWVLKTDAAGNILAVGSGPATSGGSRKIGVTRFTANGILDTTFGLNATTGSSKTGFTILDVFGSTNTAYSAAVFADGSSDFAVGGSADVQSGTNISHYYFVAKYDSTGALVLSFNNSHGVAALDWGSANNFTVGRQNNGLLVEPSDGKLVVGTGTGFSSGPYTGYNFAVARLWPN